jgi:hypothetical protein
VPPEPRPVPFAEPLPLLEPALVPGAPVAGSVAVIAPIVLSGDACGEPGCPPAGPLFDGEATNGVAGPDNAWPSELIFEKLPASARTISAQPIVPGTRSAAPEALNNWRVHARARSTTRHGIR